MKLFILAVVLTVLVVAEAKPKRCHDQEDCEENECCVRRSIFSGDCQPRGKEGDKCNDHDLVGKYFFHCPCVSDLKCEPQEVKDLGFATIKMDFKCVAGSTTVAPITTDSVVTDSVLTEAPVE